MSQCKVDAKADDGQGGKDDGAGQSREDMCTGCVTRGVEGMGWADVVAGAGGVAITTVDYLLRHNVIAQSTSVASTLVRACVSLT